MSTRIWAACAQSYKLLSAKKRKVFRKISILQVLLNHRVTHPEKVDTSDSEFWQHVVTALVLCMSFFQTSAITNAGCRSGLLKLQSLSLLCRLFWPSSHKTVSKKSGSFDALWGLIVFYTTVLLDKVPSALMCVFLFTLYRAKQLFLLPVRLKITNLWHRWN